MDNRQLYKKYLSGWSLYWVASDGFEDCFVVARNSRSARRIEMDMNGFDADDLTVHRVKSIPIEIMRAYERRRRKDSELPSWPWYPNEWFLKKLGAQFRVLDGREEALIDDVFYTTNSQRSIKPRSIGAKGLREMQKELIDKNVKEPEDSYTRPQSYLLTMLGICVARCQEIEYLIAHSFLFGISDKQKQQYKTVKDLIEGWKKKTFVQLLRAIEEGYQIEPMVKMSLDLFLSMRNQLIHGLTTSDKYDIETSWGQDELVVFLVFFEAMSRLIRKAFRASYYASMEFASRELAKEGRTPIKHLPLTRKQLREIHLFFEFFEQKQTTK